MSRETRMAIAIDLEEVDLADSRVVNLFAVIEAKGIELRNRPAYIREWVDQERAQRRRTFRTTSTPDEGVFEWTRMS